MSTVRYVSIKDAAARLSVSPDTIRRMIYANKLPHVRVGRVIRIPLDALAPDALAEGVA
ncbi:helix-turn-helix domain-containing protein [Trueperella pyogenes]|uniref:helix-turn-helix domain-containing protein n=1 Tax=Trueperella pyogenes TaxID=1661 RepID=UPI00135F1B0D|nr:helix-turn-helix domain-containing protein [Trueperella pyogenes]